MKSIVISDLHISDKPNLFQAHDDLSSFLKTLYHAGFPVELILNGDIFDFLELKINVSEGDYLFPSTLENYTNKVLDADCNQFFWQGLATLISKNGRVVIIPGNHDPELHISFVQDLIRSKLQKLVSETASNKKIDATNLIFVEGGNPYSPEGYNDRVWIVHGNKYDIWNDVDYKEFKLNVALNKKILFSPGSRIVLKLVNKYKDKYPWLDRLMLDTSLVFLLLLYMGESPKEVFGPLKAITGVGIKSIKTLITRKWRGGKLGTNMDVGEQDNDEKLEPDYKKLAEKITEYFKPSNKPEEKDLEELEKLIENGLENDELQRKGMLSVNHNNKLRKLIRKIILQNCSKDDLKLDKKDNYASKINEEADQKNQILIIGHSHIAKQIQIQENRIYFNSGSWACLIHPPAFKTDKDVELWINSLDDEPNQYIKKLTYLALDSNSDYSNVCCKLQTWPKETPFS